MSDLPAYQPHNEPASAWPEHAGVLRLARRSNHCTVLGPYARAVLWVQGCPLRCPDCVAMETLPFAGGTEQKVSELAAEIADLPEIEGVTFSGGEPMSQAAALVNLIDQIRLRRDLGCLSYTGMTIDWLRDKGTPDQHALLDRLDLLIDGPYVQARHTDLVWRGSDNQQLHLLSPRYERLRPQFNQRAQQIEIEHCSDGSVQWMGVPPRGFREAFVAAMRRQGIILLAQGNKS